VGRLSLGEDRQAFNTEKTALTSPKRGLLSESYAQEGRRISRAKKKGRETGPRKKRKRETQSSKEEGHFMRADTLARLIPQAEKDLEKKKGVGKRGEGQRRVRRRIREKSRGWEVSRSSNKKDFAFRLLGKKFFSKGSEGKGQV